jgi:multidrug efflux pump subunit AcrA (membrane-fusion protein)
MSIDTLPEPQTPLNQPRSPRALAATRNASASSAPHSQKYGWLRALLALVGIGVIVAAVVLLLGSIPLSEAAPKLTQAITRGDLIVTVTEQGTLESSDNTEIKCKVRGQNTVTWVIESGTYVEPGDELVRLDTLAIEEAIAERTKFAHAARSAAERSRADVARSKLAVSEYEQGRYRAQLMTLEKDLAVAKANLRSAQNWLRHANKLAERGFSTDIEVEQRKYAVTQAELDVEIKETEIDVLQRFSLKEELESLKGNLNASEAGYEADAERARADASRRDRALEELQYCVIKAERSGLVIYPSAAAWKDAPDIAEGATVHQSQVLLLMPNLSRMQVKVGIHESIIDRVQPGLAARITLSGRTFDAQVASVATITAPAGWWTGNVVKYDTIIQLPLVDGLKPGMSAEVEVILARHENVLMIPVAAVVQTEEGDFCWVSSDGETKRRLLELGDSNNKFIHVKAGLNEGDQVVMDPLAHVADAQESVLRTIDRKTPKKSAQNPLDRQLDNELR